MPSPRSPIKFKEVNTIDKIGERIKEVREAHNMTQQEFADKLGTRRSNIGSYETGARTPSTGIVELICSRFQVNETWLRTGAGEMKAQTTLHEELTALFAGVLKTAPDKRAMMVGALASVPPEVWDTIADQVEAFVAKHRDEWEAMYGKKG